MTINENNPVIVSVAAINQQLSEPLKGKEAVALMADACIAAADKIGCPELLSGAEELLCPQGLWSYNDPAGLVKPLIGNTQASTVLAKLGVLQQGLFNRACQRIQQGEIDIAIVMGGEAKFRSLQATIHGVELPETASTAPADLTLEPDEELWLEAEAVAGLGMPVGYYALMDSAWRHRQQISSERHRDDIAALYQRFNGIAQDNEYAWKRQPISAETIKTATSKNPMLASPYTKLHNTSWNVDQASALIFCSIKKARALGIAEEHWIYPAASTESNLMQAVSQRADLSRCFGAKHAGEKILAMADIDINDIALFELYSCFPIAVLSFADELGLLAQPSAADFTVTGGMPFAGGPLNNYVLQSTVRMIERMQAENKNYGLVSNVSGMNTKQAFCLYSKKPQAFAVADVTAEVAADSPRKNVDGNFNGEAEVVAFTVLFTDNQPERLLIIAEASCGTRAVACNQDSQLMARALEEDLIGLPVTVKQALFEPLAVTC
ncbi:acetyl-CoA C-acetyltransferase [Sinobacterium caligoides]|uniref:Acetyl-CoA C-acetyltransferase n=1 Tax=Sinobacterium caligoides TaxID=933926 RepID=A0A3N2DET0_9GAMM|nr:hypothetical protein [Sinobacterium caligoides]ROR97924.1 acetyl-CoA C-acetyltransferase [Sinobacterium caligoides]